MDGKQPAHRLSFQFLCWLAAGAAASYCRSSFAGGLVQLEGCELVLHLPVLNPAYVQFDMMIPFASGVGKMGVICWTVSSNEEGLRGALPVGDVVSKDLFP